MPSTQEPSLHAAGWASALPAELPGRPLGRFVAFDQLDRSGDLRLVAIERWSIGREASPVLEFGFVIDDDLCDMQVTVAVELLVSSDDDVDREQVLDRDFGRFDFSSGHQNLLWLVPRRLDPSLRTAGWGEEASSGTGQPGI